MNVDKSLGQPDQPDQEQSNKTMDNTHSDEGHGSHAHHHHTELKSVDRISPTEVRLTIQIPANVVTSEEARIAKRYLSQAQLPGFRPGKAPMAMIQQKFKDAIRRDVLSHLIEAGLVEGMQKAELNPISEPQIQVTDFSFGEGKPIEFQATFEVEPEIHLAKYKGISVQAPSHEVTDEEVNQTVERLRDRLAILEPSDLKTPAQGSFAETEMSFVTTDTQALHEMPTKAFSVEVGVGKLLPEIDTTLQAMGVGEQKEVKVQFPDDYFEKTLAGRPATFQVKLLEVKKKTLPELNDEFANTIKAGSTLLSLKTEIRQDIAENKKEESRKHERQQVLDYLIDNNPFRVPKSMTARQAQRLVQSMEEDFNRRGSKMPALDAEQQKSIEQSAERIVKSSMLLRAVAEKEKIELDPARLAERIRTIAEGTKQTPEQVEKFLETQGILNRMKDEILTDQVFEFLLGKSQVIRS